MDTSSNVPNIPVWQNTNLKDLPGEQWKVIPGYGSYLASNMGRIKSFKIPQKPKILRQGDSSNKKQKYSLPYRHVSLCVDGKPKNKYVHRIVVETFKGEIPKGHHVDHINNNPLDNRAQNLRIITAKENTSKPFEENPRSVLTKEKARRIRELKGVFTGSEIGKMYGVTRGMIYHIWHNRSWNFESE